MENKGNTQLEKVTESLRKFKDLSDINVSSDLSGQYLNIETANNKLKVDLNTSNKIARYLSSTTNQATSKKRVRLSKYYSNFQKKNLSIVKKLTKETMFQDQAQNYYIEQCDEKVLATVQDLRALPSTLLQLSTLTNYNALQVLIHEKGHSFAFSYNNSKEFQKINIDVFNKTFSTIKKSKRGEFTQANFDSNGHIDLMGHFAAITHDSSSFRWIVLCGRNEFFPIQDDEVTQFQNKLNVISNHIKCILRRCKNHEQLSSIIQLLEGIDLPIIVSDHSDNVIFINTAAEDMSEDNQDYYDEHIFDLGKSNTLHCYFKNDALSETDIYHYYKVNLLGELLNTLRHELSNPLFGLSLSADMLTSDEGEDAETKEFLEGISAQSQRCQTIIKNFSQLYTDEDQLKEINLAEILKETITLTKSETRGIAKSLICDLDEESLTVTTNPTWLSQVIFNLIINAAHSITDHIPLEKGIIEVKCFIQDGSMCISVTDNGQGVPEHLEKNIFDTFFTTKSEGTGLGLAICANLLNKLSAQISYSKRSDQKSGAVFTVTL